MTINRNLRFFKSEVSIPDFINAWKAEEIDAHENALLLLTFIGEEVITFLRSYTGNEVPEHKSKIPRHPLQEEGKARPEPYLGTRATHPGGWADVSGDLMRKYKYRVENDGDAWRLSIINNSDHAVYVEAMDGFFVVNGVLDQGGPVHKALIKAMAKITPGWYLQGFAGGHIDFPGAQTESIEIGPG